MANTPASALVAMPISADSKNAVGIGAEVETLTPSMAKALGVNPVKGAMVISVLEPGTKASSGLKPLDVITEVAGQPVASVADLQAATRNMRGGYMAPISVWRDHADKELSVKIVSAPAQPKAQATPVVLPVSPGWGSTSLESGLPQTSFAEWIAQETPQKYEGRSCDYLRQAYARSEQMEAVEQRETKAWGASRKAAISETLANRDCPPMVTNGRGRLAAYLTPMDPIKAARLGMPLKGASVGVVIPGGNAERAGLQRADVIVSVDATPIGDEIEFLVAIGKLPTGSTMALKVWRKSAFINVPVVVGAPL
jgi:S1-C subfamily serine protease